METPVGPHAEPLVTLPIPHSAGSILTKTELIELTGYRRAAEQLTELRRQGFYRARRSRVDGSVILERPHYDAVCTGASVSANGPRLRPVTRKRT
ncbi:DUF4224 domain-containing protein [Variovorax sp. V15]|uniref:DUF4224 domain-containing protein n=1 Tax=Variovorax sp. V15 TaxID=3065952 RepID=UPI0034E8E642